MRAWAGGSLAMCPWADFCPHRAHALCLQRRSSAAPEAQDGGTAGACPVQASLRGQPPPPAPGPPLTWAADCGLNPRFLQHGDPVDGTFNVLGEHIPVQVEEAKGKLV